MRVSYGLVSAARRKTLGVRLVPKAVLTFEFSNIGYRESIRSEFAV